jgi:hypothetical protein
VGGALEVDDLPRPAPCGGRLALRVARRRVVLEAGRAQAPASVPTEVPRAQLGAQGVGAVRGAVATAFRSESRSSASRRPPGAFSSSVPAQGSAFHAIPERARVPPASRVPSPEGEGLPVQPGRRGSLSRLRHPDRQDAEIRAEF